MKSNRFVVAPVAAFLLLGSASAFAQPNSLTAPMNGVSAAKTALTLAPLDNANWRAITIQNARPSMLAYMLDPAHNSLPASFNIPGSLSDKFRQGDDELKKVPKGPFDGLRLVGADKQKLLFVSGKDEAQIAELQAMVALMDKAERLVTIEAQIVELTAKDAEQFGIDFNAATAGDKAPIQGAFQLGFVRNDFQKRLGELVKDGKATLVSTQPQRIINNNSLAVSLLSGPIDNTGANQYKMPPAPKDGSRDTIVTLTPTINGDDTITVLMKIATLPKDVNSPGLTTIANVRDGDTIALSGLKSPIFPRQIPTLDKIPLMNSTPRQSVPLLGNIPLIGELFRSKKLEDDRVTLVFVSARIVRNEK